MRLRTALVMSSVALGAPLARAQTPPPAPEATAVSPLTVTARAKPASPPSETQALQSYVQDHAVVSRNDRLARWREPICPITFGGPEADNAFITARIKTVAQSVGVAVDPSAKCRSNVEVIFSTYPQQLISLIYRRHPLFIGYHYESQTKALVTFDKPIKSWYATATRSSAMGQPGAALAGVPGGSDSGAGDAVLDETWGPSPGGSAGTRIDDSLATELANVLIIVDQKQVAGYTLGEIADYVSMLALSQPPTLSACGTLDSILDLLSPACRPDQKPRALTASDTAYLTALYKANLNLAKGFSESQIIDLMKSADRK